MNSRNESQINEELSFGALGEEVGIQHYKDYRKNKKQDEKIEIFRSSVNEDRIYHRDRTVIIDDRIVKYFDIKRSHDGEKWSVNATCIDYLRRLQEHDKQTFNRYWFIFIDNDLKDTYLVKSEKILEYITINNVKPTKSKFDDGPDYFSISIDLLKKFKKIH